MLKTAAVYSLSCGLFGILFPNVSFLLLGVEPLPNYPELWQGIGVIVGIYGVGYWCASFDPIRHWPVVLVGLLGKILFPAGFLVSVMNDGLPWRFGILVLVNDVIWWIPFASMLLYARRYHLASKTPTHFVYSSTAVPVVKKRAASSPVVRLTVRASGDSLSRANQ